MAETLFPKSPYRSDALAGRVALITGGGSGIGFEIARQMALHGAKVCVKGRREKALQEAVASIVKDGGVAMYAQGDVRSFESCQAAVAATVKSYGKLDILVNCAAGNFLASAESISSKGFRTVMEIDTFGTFHMSTAAFPEMKKGFEERRADSVILNITAEFNYPPFFQSHAAAAKMAINSLTKSHSLEWSDFGIRVNGIAPGPIANTAGINKLGGMGGSDPNSGRPSMFQLNAELPRGLQFGLTWDIAMAAVFYCSAAGQYCSGDTMIMDGGHYLRSAVPLKASGHLKVDREAMSELSRGRETTLKQKQVGVAGVVNAKL